MKYQINQANCTRCGLCLHGCAQGAIFESKVIEPEGPYVIDEDLCTKCGDCTEVCTADAIKQIVVGD